MASPLIIRKGEGKKTIMIGPDPWSFRITGADVDGRFDFIEATLTYLQGPPCTFIMSRTIPSSSLKALLRSRLAMNYLSCTREMLSALQRECHIRSQTWGKNRCVSSTL
jgi:hypothetical protein